MYHLLFLTLIFNADVDSIPIKGTKEEIHLNANLTGKTLQDTKSNPETVEELVSKEHALVEGDIVLPFDKNQVGHPWPKAEKHVIVAYNIHPDLVNRTHDIEIAMTWVSTRTCVTFRKRTTEEDYLNFEIGNGCASYVGYVGGGQPVVIGPYCSVGNICHEILHGLGFHHEHTRLDREDHVEVLYDNVIDGKELNFEIQQGGNTFGLPYDQGSILHYGSDFFSKNGLPTIIPKNPSDDMGQRTHLTELDVEKVKHFYNCGDDTQPDVKEEKPDGAGN